MERHLNRNIYKLVHNQFAKLASYFPLYVFSWIYIQRSILFQISCFCRRFPGHSSRIPFLQYHFKQSTDQILPLQDSTTQKSQGCLQVQIDLGCWHLFDKNVSPISFMLHFKLVSKYFFFKLEIIPGTATRFLFLAMKHIILTFYDNYIKLNNYHHLVLDLDNDSFLRK